MNSKSSAAWSDLITPDLWISHRFDMEARQYQVEAYVKVHGPRGIRMLLWWGQEFDQELLLRDAPVLGTFSARPYRLGHGGDSTTGACIDALYHHFCAAKQLDPTALYYRAYQKRTEHGYDEDETRQFAEWQGLVCPNQWRDTEVVKLLQDLRSINNHGLVASILEALPHLEQRWYAPARPRCRKNVEQQDEAG